VKTDLNLKTIWIVEDEDEITSIYMDALSSRYKLDAFNSIHSFTQSLNGSSTPDLIICDIRLPDGNFLQFLKDNGHTMKHIPYFVVSAVVEDEALNFCLNQGAVDYLTKPFHINELKVKIDRFFDSKEQLSKNPKKSNLLNENFINTKLTYKESKIVTLLMNQMDQYVSRKDIIEKVWNNVNVHPKTLDVHLYNLRRKIETLGFHILSDSTGRLKLTQIDSQ
jgi:DNA-binding response OmpR family regulator